MSKNFEEEYKALANEELPDLWNRIEAGLTPKTTVLAEEEKEKKSEEKRRKEKVISLLYKYRTVAVAALCVIVILPAVMVFGRVRSGGNKSWEEANESAPMQAEDTAAADGWDGAVAAAGDTTEDVITDAQAKAGDVSQEGMLADEDLANGSAADAFSRAEHEIGEDSGAALPADMEADDAEKKMENSITDLSSSGQGEAKKESVEEESDVRVYEKVTVKVVQGTREMAEADRELYGEVKMKVIKDPSGELAEGSEISVWVALSSSVAYLEGKEYTLDISYDPNRDCPYRIA